MKNRERWILILGIIIYLANRLLLNDIGADDQGRMVGALSILNGEGYRVLFTNFDELPSVELHTKNLYNMWPALLSYMYAWLSKITGNVLLSYYILEVLFSILFLSSFYRTLQLFSTSKLMNIGFLVFCGSAFFPFKVISIDIAALSIGTYAIYYLAKHSKQMSTTNWFVFSLMLSLTCLFRFNYYAIALVPFISLILQAFLKKKSIHWPSALATILPPLLIIIGQTVLIKSASTSVAFISSNSFHLHWQNLLLAKPPIATLLLNIDTDLFHRYLTVYCEDDPYNAITNSINLCLNFIEISFIIILIKKVSRTLSYDIFNLVLVLIVVISYGSIYGLSILMEPLNIIPTRQWTFASETRYLALAIICIVLLLWYNRRLITVPFSPLIFKTALIISLVASLTIHGYRLAANKYNYHFRHYHIYALDYKEIVQQSQVTYLLSNDINYTGVSNIYGRPSYGFATASELSGQLKRIKSFHSASSVLIVDTKSLLNTSEVSKMQSLKNTTFEIEIRN